MQNILLRKAVLTTTIADFLRKHGGKTGEEMKAEMKAQLRRAFTLIELLVVIVHCHFGKYAVTCTRARREGLSPSKLTAT
ncbi:type II secretion system GspH family protein [bacterium]|nr:type II secretion system GspH family protein [bacterium]